MKIRNKLILIYLAITAVLLSFFCVVIYLQSKEYRRSEFKERLRKEALSTANIYFNKNDISPEVLKLLDRNDFTALTNEEIVIFDSKNQVIYETGDDRFKIEGEILEKIKAEKEYFWENTESEYIGILFENQNQKYVIVSYAVDNYGFIKLQNLAYVLIFGGLCILFLSALTGWFFVERMLNPIQQIIKKIDKIKASQLGERLAMGNENDEFTQLADRFNQMLDRLQKSFLAQKAFVSHASHELRTPLTSITGQIQVSLLAEDSPEDLKKMIQSVLEDVKQLNRLSNNLLDLTSLNSYSENTNLTLVNVLDKLSRVRDEAIKKKFTLSSGYKL
jgi:signal transduction histidine kinase